MEKSKTRKEVHNGPIRHSTRQFTELFDDDRGGEAGRDRDVITLSEGMHTLTCKINITLLCITFDTTSQLRQDYDVMSLLIILTWASLIAG